MTLDLKALNRRMGDIVPELEGRRLSRGEDYVFAHQMSLLALLDGLRRPGHLLHAAEIGVFCGHTSEFLLANIPELCLLMVDPWRASDPASDYAKSKDAVARLTPEQLAEAYRTAMARTLRFEDRAAIVPQDSLTAAADVADGKFDLVFIDAEHTYSACKADIAAWWPKVRAGGILSGHDYGHRRYAGVTQAVCEFADGAGLVVNVRPGRVWYVHKNNQ